MCKQLIAVLPGPVLDFKASLSSPQTITTSWKKPETGGPVTGYRISYWDKPENVKQLELDSDVSNYEIKNFFLQFFFVSGLQR